jgi:DNA-binding MarR family transcriptional regulator
MMAARSTASKTMTAHDRLLQPDHDAQVQTGPSADVTEQAVDRVDSSFLEALIGYNARRAALTIISHFLPRMAQFGLRPVEFSVMTLIGHNAGITARQLCAALDLQPPNLVGMLKGLEKRGLLEKREHPSDRRAQGLHLTAEGAATLERAQETALELEIEATPSLTQVERLTLNRLLRKVYRAEA